MVARLPRQEACRGAGTAGLEGREWSSIIMTGSLASARVLAVRRQKTTVHRHDACRQTAGRQKQTAQGASSSVRCVVLPGGFGVPAAPVGGANSS